MAYKTFKCTKCGYIPRDLPVSGSWYCPKCGKRTAIPQKRPRATRKFYKKPTIATRSRDQITTKLYNKMTYDKPTDRGFKEPYLNPKIKPIPPAHTSSVTIGPFPGLFLTYD